ncbi:hypothetical protein NCER_101426 [Vairimorpha ceranae BRL01]|uniref:Uncharacterized protein n=2 Tax=Vairimorpha ceranae TaxID=40302 RepID=C4VA00_VAIC1|nr:hypothetical protein AAJ76_930003411 [Vairimorpha ceranae]EEQ81953.1 hypothetical protein NCER_101426 [Vairimorpha ceranae BRL01]KKO74253.1 hypothetical protein AAJ76_930003411 [Vairimorpha ceranae]
MLSIFLQLFCCAHQEASTSTGESENIFIQLCSFVETQLEHKEYFRLKKLSRNLYVCVEIRDKFIMCYHPDVESREIGGKVQILKIVYTEDILTTEIGTSIHGFLKSFDVDSVFIYTTKDNQNHLRKEDVQKKIIFALEELSSGESKPKYYFKGYVFDGISLVARTRNKNDEWDGQLMDLHFGGNLDIRFDGVIASFKFVFDIDLNYFDFKTLLKKYLKREFNDKNAMLYKFLTNFNFVNLFYIKNLVDVIVSGKKTLALFQEKSPEEREEAKKRTELSEGLHDGYLSIGHIEIYKCLEWIERVSIPEQGQDGNFRELIEKSEEVEGKELNAILLFMFSISRHKIFKLLLAHVLCNKDFSRRSFIVEILFQLDVIDNEIRGELLGDFNIFLIYWEKKIEYKFSLAPLYRLDSRLSFHNTLIRYLHIALFEGMDNLLEKNFEDVRDCEEIKESLSTFFSDYENLLQELFRDLRKKPWKLKVDGDATTKLRKISYTLYDVINKIFSSSYWSSFTYKACEELVDQCRKVMNYDLHPNGKGLTEEEEKSVKVLLEKLSDVAFRS